MSDNEEIESNNTAVDLSEELKYRKEVSVADRLNVFREKDKEQQQLDKQRKEEEEKKRAERKRKEEERLRKEEERKMKIRQQLEEKENLRRQQDQERTENLASDVETNEDDSSINYDQREVALRRQRVSEGHFDENDDGDRSVKVDLSDELKYRETVRVSDRLSAFKDAEREEQARKKREREEEEKKRAERKRKEEERLRKEEERKMKIRQQLEEKERQRRESEKNKSESEEMKDEADELSRQDSEINYDMTEVAALRRRVAEGNFEMENESSSTKVDLSEELKYRGEMKMSDRLAAFKDAEKEERDRLQRQKQEEARKKRERQQKEEERLRREEERKQKILRDIQEKERIKQEQEEERRRREAEKEVISNDTFVDLKSELQYRDEMETKVSDRLASLKRVEKESFEQSKSKKEEDERKLAERKQKEQERMRREEERKREIQLQLEKQRQLTGNNTISIEKEREILQQVDEDFRVQKYTQEGGKTVLKRWTSSSPDSPPQRRSSDDSGIVNEDSMEAQVLSDDQCAPCDERMKEFESGLSDESNKDNNVNNNEEMMRLIENEKSGLLVRLDLVETRAAEAKAYYENLINEGATAEAVEYEEEYHEASLEISRIKQRLLQLENPSREMLRRQASTENTKTSRECKAPISRPRPPVDVMSYNDDGECVPEGIITNRLETFKTDVEAN